MPRFVILRHAEYPGRNDHYDLMLEKGQSLKTWELEDVDFSRSRTAIQKPDHRLTYLQYEGDISGNRGKVYRVEAGTYESMDEEAHQWRVRFKSKTLNGEFLLQRLSNDASEWRFVPENSSLETRQDSL